MSVYAINNKKSEAQIPVWTPELSVKPIWIRLFYLEGFLRRTSAMFDVNLSNERFKKIS